MTLSAQTNHLFQTRIAVEISIKLAVRDWDFITPLVLGDVRSNRFNLELHRVNALENNLATDPRYDGGEMSLSRYAQSRARGDTSIVGIPYFIMRGFRQHCIITTEASPLTELRALAGKRIGMTGWQDSGNTWTRALLRREGVEIADAEWFVGRLSDDHPIQERLNGFGRPGRISTAPGERPLVDLLREGTLDAVFTPFMPVGFFEPGSGLRTLQSDCRAAEVAYFKEVGYMPGIHLLGLKPAIVAKHPWIPQALGELFAESSRVWMEKRMKYADTTPWILDEIRQSARDLPGNWNASGFKANERMLTDFCQELHAQEITPGLLNPADLFPGEAT
ncbi:MAG TPA: nitrate ABC transporter substrate-binding protein [Polaromonas sp.]|jgi:4,5-dihydroxyphthalate decarboxylase